jgi:hypothetical protein
VGTPALRRSSIFDTSSSRLVAPFHSAIGFRNTYVSPMFGPIGSVAISGLPMRLTTVSVPAS